MSPLSKRGHVRALQIASQDWDGTVPERDGLETSVVLSIKLSLSSAACCNVVRLVGTDLALRAANEPKGNK
jgi:hypothetical protein